MSTSMERKLRRFFRRHPRLAYVLTGLLVGCIGSVYLTLWLLLRSDGQAAGLDGGERTQNTNWAQALPLSRLVLPEPTRGSEPTATATQVVFFASTATRTPTPPPSVGEGSFSLRRKNLSPTPNATSQPLLAPTPASNSTILAPPLAPPQPEIKHVVIISIDGLRPDALELADTPALDHLRLNGAYSPNARAVLPSDTMPNHASLLSGVTPAKHGILWNLPFAEAPRLNSPTLFSIAHQAGLSTAMVVGKAKLEYLVLPNSVDQFSGHDTTDVEVKNRASELIRAGLPNVLLIHLPDVDKAGHNTGWLSPGQLQAVAVTDGFIGELVATLREGGYLDSTLLLVTADHGGSGTGHGSDSIEDTTIPWLAIGPGVPAGVTLTGPIHIYDTAATVLYALKLPLPAEWDGRPVLEIFVTSTADR